MAIDPVSVARAYQRLTDAGILAVRRGEGTYVAEHPPVMSRSERARILREAATRYASLAATLGIPREEAAEALDTAWRRLEQKGVRT